ncbi:Hypp8370 [Branchiostoma lanceolatum]|uniref:Hypp8370 protein n=1 Tax=Branchiostoma lanceolatum TaxID=7740 RepID=A0A8J9Z6L6_BRALA|nr:Hypp8370 [Branchiostoma lanceolatum]
MLSFIHGDLDGAILGATETICAFATPHQVDKFIVDYKKGKYLQGKFNTLTKKFESTDGSMNQAIALKYRGFLSRRKYDVQCRTISSVFDPTQQVWLPRSVRVDGVDVQAMRQLSHYKLDMFVKSIDFGSLYHLPRELGVTSVEETDTVMADLWQQHTEEMALLEGSTFTINVSKHNMVVVGGSIGETWQPWTAESRLRDAEKDLQTLGLGLKSVAKDLQEQFNNEATRHNKCLTRLIVSVGRGLRMAVHLQPTLLHTHPPHMLTYPPHMLTYPPQVMIVNRYESSLLAEHG